MNRTICCLCPGKQGSTESTGELRREGRQKPAADLKILCRNNGFSRDELQPLLKTKARAEEIGLLWFWREATQIKPAWPDPLPSSRGDTGLVRKWEQSGSLNFYLIFQCPGCSTETPRSEAPGCPGDPPLCLIAVSLCNLWSVPVLFRPKPKATAGHRVL